LKILVVEDDLDIANLHKLVLESANHTVIMTLNGKECIDKFKQGVDTFDAILLDYRMPILDGIQTAKEILKVRPSQRIIIATGQLKDTILDAIKELGKIIEIISKPFEPDLLLEVIEDRMIDSKLGS
jgi:DNA-binding NtrC family response regulator